MGGIMAISKNGKHEIKEVTSYKEPSPGPWSSDIQTTDRSTLTMTVRDGFGYPLAFVNELNHHSEANLALIGQAPALLHALRHAVEIIRQETRDHDDFLKQVNDLITKAGSNFSPLD
jgi:hypothetical protein